MKKIITIICFLVLVLSCSKSDEALTDNPIGGDVFRYQIVAIDLPNTALNATEYHGSMGSIAITLNKNDDHQLVFMIPGTLALGSQDLIINDLNNLKVNYNIKLPILTSTPENTVAELQTNINTLIQTLDLSDIDNQNIQQASTNFNTIFTNASEADKNTIAIIYHVNKAAIDNMILNDYSSVTGRYNQNADILLHKCKLSLLAMGTGVVLMQFGVEPLEKAAGTLLTIIGFGKALKFFKEFVVIKINSIAIEFDDVLGINNRNSMTASNATLNLVDNTATSVAFKTIDRTVIASDSNKTEQGMALFFKSFTKINSFATTLNPIITWVNSNVPFANFSLLPFQTLATSNTAVPSPVDANTFQKITFNITDPGATLVNINLSNTGQINVKVKVNGTQTLPYATFINYNYSDNYSSFSGKIPITITNSQTNTDTVTIGTQIWMNKNLDVATYSDGTPIPQVTDPLEWANLTTGAWCYYNNDPANGALYGKLYNWYAVNGIYDAASEANPALRKKLAPTGWHVPGWQQFNWEFDILSVSLGVGVNSLDLPRMLKSTGTIQEGNGLWWNFNDATNSSGFTAHPGGKRMGNGVFIDVHLQAYWWGKEDFPGATDFKYTGISGGYYYNAWSNNKRDGFSVRCIKD